MRLPLLALAALTLLRATPALAWAETGHRLIGVAAAQSFPPEIPAFLRTRDAVWRLGELSREPDRSKGAGQPHDADLDPGHFLNADDQGRIAGGPTLAALPPNRQAYEKALQAAGADSWKYGWLPYSIVDGWQQLVKDFAYWRVDRLGERTARSAADRDWFARDRALREIITLRDLGYWGHFVGDAAQPMHVSIHFNGWGDFPNPNNYSRERIHAAFEGAYVRATVTDPAVVRAAMTPYTPCGCTVQQANARYLQASLSQVEPLYRLWGEGGFQRGDPRGRAFLIERLGAGASQLRDMVVEAWRASDDAEVGYPQAKVRDIERAGVVPLDILVGRE